MALASEGWALRGSAGQREARGHQLDGAADRGTRPSQAPGQNGVLDTGTTPPCRGECGTGSAKRRHAPLQAFSVRAGSRESQGSAPERGSWKIPPLWRTSRYLKEGRDAEPTEPAGCRRSRAGLAPVPRVSLEGRPGLSLAAECPRGLWGGKSLWFPWVQETESLECGLPGEGGAFS